MTGDIIRFNHNGNEITAAVLSEKKHKKCLIVTLCEHGYKCRTRAATFDDKNKISFYCLLNNKKREVITIPIKAEVTKISHVCSKHMKFLLNKYNPSYSMRSNKNGSSSHTLGGSALTSIYYTGQRIGGGYNTHKG